MPETPTIAPPMTPVRSPEQVPWPERYTDPGEICPQQRREGTSPDVAP